MNLPPIDFQPAAQSGVSAAPAQVLPRAPEPRPLSQGAKPAATVLSLTIKSKSALFAAFMPLLNNGGLFIPTNKHYAVGDEVLVLLTLMDFPEKLSFSGTVAWVTPPGAQNGKIQGIGVHFNPDKAGQDVKNKIRAILGNLVNSSRPTHTI
jgi:type IV pilus assembly protein PilZ